MSALGRSLVGAALAALIAWGLLQREAVTAFFRPDAAPQPTAQAEDAPAPKLEQAPQDASTPEDATGARREAQTAPGPASPSSAEPDAQPAAAGNAAPGIDVLRVEPDGAATIAGRAAPGATVDILVDDEKVGEARAGRDGSFAAFVDIPGSDAPRQIELAARDESGVRQRSEAPVFLAPAARERVEPESAPAKEEASGAAREAAETPLAVRPTEDGVEIVQRPALPATAPVALDALSYDDSGALTLQGRARPGRAVRVYAGRKLIAEGVAAADGGWEAASAEPLAPGAYNLRIDEVDAGGKVVTRSETPFLRSAEPARAPAPGEIVVQPGDTLWAIAFNRYGRGPRYAVIFEANKDRIRDPDLIYPGQIFAIPAEAAE